MLNTREWMTGPQSTTNQSYRPSERCPWFHPRQCVFIFKKHDLENMSHSYGTPAYGAKRHGTQDWELFLTQKRHFGTTLLFSSLHCHQATLDARGWARRTPPQSEQLARQRNNLNLINVKTFSYNKCFLMVGITAPARLLKVQNDMRHRTGNWFFLIHELIPNHSFSSWIHCLQTTLDASDWARSSHPLTKQSAYRSDASDFIHINTFS